MVTSNGARGDTRCGSKQSWFRTAPHGQTTWAAPCSPTCSTPRAPMHGSRKRPRRPLSATPAMPTALLSSLMPIGSLLRIRPHRTQLRRLRAWGRRTQMRCVKICPQKKRSPRRHRTDASPTRTRQRMPAPPCNTGNGAPPKECASRTSSSAPTGRMSARTSSTPAPRG